MRTIKETIALMAINGLIGGGIVLTGGAAYGLLLYLTGAFSTFPINPFAVILVLLTLGFWFGVSVTVDYLDKKDHGRLQQSHRDEGR